MPFQPFGFPFSITSPMPPSDVKRAIRSRKKHWFHSKDGTRGWIIGPLLCLWSSPSNQTGPMLLGWISGDGFEASIRGRAGSDLNGMAMTTLFLPLLGVLIYRIAAAEQRAVGEIVATALLVLIFSLNFWLSHRDRRQAEPLVRFIEDAVALSGRSPPRAPPNVQVNRPLSLNVSGEYREGGVASETIHETYSAPDRTIS